MHMHTYSGSMWGKTGGYRVRVFKGQGQSLRSTGLKRQVLSKLPSVPAHSHPSQVAP